ncbi:FHA domain-containing protein [Microbacterium sp. MAHUQ-60]|uniref:FHA domain-containing protein n=1 Tax=unclassified Microbacterium TaxID=2609290 RepID=UPI003618FF02
MSDVVYRPGEWQVVVEESGIAALPADASAEKVVALSAMLSRGVPELTEVIDVLSGGAITGLGSFAVALIGPTGTRFAVRGSVTVTTGWDASFSGEDITTWSERFIAEPARFEIGFGDPAETVAYPIRSGVVLASGVRVGEPFAEPVADAPEDADRGAADLAALPIGADAVDDAPTGAATDEPETDEAETAPDAPTAEPEAEPAESEGEPAESEGEPAESEGEPAVPAEPENQDEDESDDVPTETIAPDELALVRADAHEEPWNDPLAQPDLGATIVPPAQDEQPQPASAPFAPAPPAAAPAVVPPAPPAAPGLDIGDHDGATISLSEARRLRATTSAPDAPTEVLPTLPSDAAGSTSARIRLSTGQVVELDRVVIIGRKPRSTRASGSTMPHLIAVDSPESDISRNHLEVRPEGDSVVVIDLHTTNGSTLLRPGADPVRLHPGEQTLVLGGDVIDIGDGVTVAIEEFG